MLDLVTIARTTAIFRLYERANIRSGGRWLADRKSTNVVAYRLDATSPWPMSRRLTGYPASIFM